MEKIKLHKRHLVDSVSIQLGIHPGDVSSVVNSVFEGIKELTQQGYIISICKFGNFSCERKPKRLMNSKLANKIVEVPEREVFKFTCSESFRLNLKNNQYVK